MKRTIFASCIVSLLTSLSVSQAQTTIADWDFDLLGTQAAPYNSPAPTTGAGTATVLGMTNNYNDGTTPSLAYADITAQGGASTGSGSLSWRIRGGSVSGGAGTPNGWSTNAPIATQGAQFASSTAGYQDIQVTFDLFTTSAAEAPVAFLFSTNGGSSWVTNLPIVYLGSLPTTAENNTSDPQTIMGPYLLLQQSGGGWYNQITVDLSSFGTVNNNPQFAFEIVNAATGTSCFNQTGGIYNNNSGNWRWDNVIISGQVSGASATPPVITPSAVATVDSPFTDTFTDDPTWRSDITSITANGTTLPLTAYSVTAGKIVFTPSASSALQKAGTVNIVISANNYAADLVSQSIAPGAAKSMTLSSVQGPTGNGGTLVSQPTLTFQDQYGNIATNCSATYTATPSAGWSFGTGSGTAQTLVNGTVTFTNLSAVSASVVSGATISLTASATSGLSGVPFTTTNTTAFNIPAPGSTVFTTGDVVVEQEDLVTANSTFTMLELNPATPNQPAPVLTLPIPATGTNALRQSSSGSTGRLANSQDGTLLCFTAGQLGDSSVSDITTISNRGCGTFNSQGTYNLATTYLGIGGSTANQTRSATTLDDVNFYMGDKGGVYLNGETPDTAYIGYTANNQANVRSLRAYNGTLYALQQEGGTDPQASVMGVVEPPSAYYNGVFELEGFPIDGSDVDFQALSSGANGTNIDVIYYIDGTNNTSGAIFKFTNSFTVDFESGEQVWAQCGSYWPTTNGGDGFCAATNANGGFDLYYTTGKGGTAGNSVVHMYDSSPWNQPMNMTSYNILYTVSASSTLKGLAFAPIPVISSLSNVAYTGAGFSFNFTSPAVYAANTNFTVWSTTILNTNIWTSLGHPTGPTGGNVYSFTDTSAKNSSHTFYRVTSP